MLEYIKDINSYYKWGSNYSKWKDLIRIKLQLNNFELFVNFVNITLYVHNNIKKWEHNIILLDFFLVVDVSVWAHNVALLSFFLVVNVDV